MDIRKLSPEISVAGQLDIADIATAAKLGFRTIIDNRPDHEGGPDQPVARQLQAAAQQSGVGFHFQPVVSGGITAADVATFKTLLSSAEQPVLAFCRTGTRCAMLWALAQSGRQSAAEIIAAAAQAGYDVSALRTQLAGGSRT